MVLAVQRFVSAMFLFNRRRFFGRWPVALLVALLATLSVCVAVDPYHQIAELRNNALSPDEHMVNSVEQAVNKSLCDVDWGFWNPNPGEMIDGKPSQALRDFLNKPGLNEIPLKRLVETRSRPLPGYCNSMTHFKNNENAISWFYTGVLKVYPNASVIGLFKAATTVRIAILAFVAFALMLVGFGAIFAIATIFVGIELHSIVSATHPLSMYPFMTFQLVAFLAVFYVVYCSTKKWSPTRWLALGIITGVSVDLILNVRTSHGMMAGLVAITAFLLLLIRGQEFLGSTHRLRVAAWTICSAIFAGVAFHSFMIPKVDFNVQFNSSYHTISHPLVLGLAVPPNPLAQREGISWNDRVGGEIAKRIDPAATLLGPTYEHSMFVYYFGLWRKYPLEMVDIYERKLELAGTDIPKWVPANMSRVATFALYPAMLLMRSGWLWLLCQTAMFAIGALLFLRNGTAHWLALSLFGSVGVLLVLENGIILPSFTVTHYSSMVTWALLTALTIYQVLINGLVTGVRKFWNKSNYRSALQGHRAP